MSWFEYEKSTWGISATLTIFGRVAISFGKTEHWGISANICFYDRSINLEILNLWFAIEVYRKDIN